MSNVLLFEVKNELSTKINQVKSKLDMFLSSFAETQNSVPKWGEFTKPKWYIIYDHIENRFTVDCTYRTFYPNITYFNDKHVAKSAIVVYKVLLQQIIQMEYMKNRIHNDEVSNEELENIRHIILNF